MSRSVALAIPSLRLARPLTQGAAPLQFGATKQEFAVRVERDFGRSDVARLIGTTIVTLFMPFAPEQLWSVDTVTLPGGAGMPRC